MLFRSHMFFLIPCFVVCKIRSQATTHGVPFSFFGNHRINPIIWSFISPPLLIPSSRRTRCVEPRNHKEFVAFFPQQRQREKRTWLYPSVFSSTAHIPPVRNHSIPSTTDISDHRVFFIGLESTAQGPQSYQLWLFSFFLFKTQKPDSTPYNKSLTVFNSSRKQ